MKKCSCGGPVLIRDAGARGAKKCQGCWESYLRRSLTGVGPAASGYKGPNYDPEKTWLDFEDIAIGENTFP